MRDSRKKHAVAPRAKKRPSRRQPRPGDWLVYAPDRTTLLDFGRDLGNIRNRVERKGTNFSDCFLSRQPFGPDEPMEIGGIEIEIR